MHDELGWIDEWLALSSGGAPIVCQRHPRARDNAVIHRSPRWASAVNRL
jgi:hypothetical protein